MIKEFYKKALPSTGVYCVATIDPVAKITKHKFVESIDDLESFVESKKDSKTNIFVAMSSFKGYSRKADEAIYARSFFIDLDVGENKEYKSKKEALDDLDKFVLDAELPDPVIVDSGGGIHAYWFLDRDVTTTEWKPYAEKFKDFCISRGLKIDPVVTADAARILRSPDTFNHKSDPPSRTYVYRHEDLPVYSFDQFKDFLGELTQSQDDIIASIPKGKLTEDQRKAAKLDNFETKFADLAVKSLNGQGCHQIKFILENAKSLTEPVWRAGLSIAVNCSDGEEAIHMMSEEHPGYTRDATIKKTILPDGKRLGPYFCKTFDEVNPGGCEGCPFKNKVTTPINIGKELQTTAPSENAVVHTPDPVTGTVLTQLKTLPQELYPYVYGKNGGIYYMVAERDEHDNVIAQNPITVSLYDIYPVKRIFSVADGECLLMKATLPNDPEREFLLPLKHVYAVDRFKETIASNGVLFNPGNKEIMYLMNYIITWGQYLMNKNSAEVMRMQMGWTPNRQSFVIGGTEYLRDGTDVSSPTSPLCRGIAKHLQPMGTYEAWQEAANKLNMPSLELHAFTMLAGMGSALMDYTSTSGVTLCLTGESGAAKTGALYSALSVWGNPKDLSVLEATENGMTGRYLGLHNIPFGLDEVGNILPKTLSQLIHKISQGKSKIRMQASVNAERDHEMSASLVAIFTSNQSLYDKLTTLKKDPNGEVARLIEMMVRKPDAFKDDAHLGREIFDQFRFNYGWAGPEFIKAVYRTGEQGVSKLLDEWCLRFKKDFGEDTAYRFYENVVAAAMTAGEIAINAKIIKFDLDRVYRRIVGEMIAIRDNVVKVNSVNYESILSDYINKNQSGILAFKDNKITMEPRMALVIRVENDSNMMYISKTEFDKYLNEGGISTKEFLFQINALGIKVDASRSAQKRMSAGWKDIGKSVTRVYKIDLSTMPNIHLGDEDNDQ